MSAVLTPIDPQSPDPALIEDAAQFLKNGELVIFPTETVYGLGGNALNAEAIKKIYAAKGRPSKNPLIVHVASVEQAKTFVSNWPEHAEKLAEAFWPGPLTFVLPKNDSVPSEVTGGGPTIAIRIPAHPVALALINACGFPIAAPSANTSGEISATKGSHISKELMENVAMMLDAGQTEGGIESTVIDLTISPPRILRPGLISAKNIEHIIGTIDRSTHSGSRDDALPSPGMLSRHYAPRTPMILGTTQDVEESMKKKLRVGFLPCEPKDHRAYAAKLYDALHEFDRQHLDLIVVEPPPETDDWLAVRDRLTRASAKE